MNPIHLRLRRLSAISTVVALFGLVIGTGIVRPTSRSPGSADRAVSGADVRALVGKEGYPDRYAAHELMIRTADGEAAPGYAQNYLMDALTRARRAAKSGATVLPWRERGPGNVGGRTRALVVDPDDPAHDTWYAAAVSGGIWKTTDEGSTWQHLTAELPNLAFSTLVQAPSDPNVLYAGSGEGFFNGDAVAGAGVFRSADRGATWTQLAATADNTDFRFVNRLIVSPDDAGLLVAATRTGIFRSADSGASWSRVHQAQPGPGILQVVSDANDFSRQFASESGVGVLRSLDAGATWSPASDGLFSLDDGAILGSSRIELAIAPGNSDRLYAAVESESGTDRLFTSRDGGDLWYEVEPAAGTSNPDWTSSQGWYNNAIAVDPFDEQTVFLGGLNVLRVSPAGAADVGVVRSLDEENTASFLDFVSFNGATHFGGRLKTGLTEDGADVSDADFVSVEVRFGPGRSQFAHRFKPPDKPGIPFSAYPYADYVEVPFEVWDVTNNRQLMVSFRDRLNDGFFNLIERDQNNLGREYILIHADTYDGDIPHPAIAQSGGTLHKLLYFFWPILATDGRWEPTSLPVSTLRINHVTVSGVQRNTEQISSGAIVHVDQHTIVPVVTDTGSQSFELLVANDGGIFHSKDGGTTWLSRNRGYNTSQYYSIDKRPLVGQYLGGTQDNGTWRSFVDPSRTQGWLRAFSGDGFDVVWNQRDHNLVVGSIQFNELRRSTNAGVSWSFSQSGMTDVGDPDTGGGGQFLTSIDRGSQHPDRVFTIGKSGVWRSVNFGITWSLVPVPPADWGFRGSGLVRVSIADDDVVWAGYEMGVRLSGPDDVLGKLHVSTDGGLTFNSVPTPDVLSSGHFSGLATHPTDPGTAYVLFSTFGNAKIIRTRDFGQTWEDLSGFAGNVAKRSANGFPDVAVYDLLALPHKPTELWAATEIGLFISRDDGASWQFADNGLPAVSIWRMRLVDDEILIATHGRGVWTLDVADLVAVDVDAPAETPLVYALEANYPNPFNPATTVTYSLPQPEDVELSVFDALGRRVETLVKGSLPAGKHTARWEASRYASGLYFVRLKAGSFESTRKMTLLR